MRYKERASLSNCRGLNMKRLLAFAGPVLSLAAVASTARASSVTYTYTGNDYTIAGPPWTTSMFISASLTFASSLPDNLPDITTETSNVESWTVNDGIYTYSNGQAASYETYIFAFGQDQAEISHLGISKSLKEPGNRNRRPFTPAPHTVPTYPPSHPLAVASTHNQSAMPPTTTIRVSGR